MCIRDRGNGISDVAMLTGLKLVPKTEIKPPGAMSPPKLPAFTTEVMLGGGTEEAKFQGSTVTPETVRFMMAVWLASGAMVRVKGEAADPSSGASTIWVALLTEAVGLVMSMRSMTPGELL